MGPFIRIAMRYVAMALIAKGYLGKEDGDTLANDGDVFLAVEMMAGFTIAAVTEGWYWLAKRFGWSK